MVTEPCAGTEFAVTVRPVPTSLAKTVDPVSVVLAGVVPVSFTGPGPTAMLTVAVVVCPEPSVAVYVKESSPV